MDDNSPAPMARDLFVWKRAGDIVRDIATRFAEFINNEAILLSLICFYVCIYVVAWLVLVCTKIDDECRVSKNTTASLTQ